MNDEAKELMQFMKQIDENKNDAVLRNIFADWLDEHDEPEEADRHRKKATDILSGRAEAEEWMRAFCAQNYADYDDLVDSVAAGEGYCFGDDDGPCAAQEEDFWKYMEILTGKEDLDKDQGFRCAC